MNYLSLTKELLYILEKACSPCLKNKKIKSMKFNQLDYYRLTVSFWVKVIFYGSTVISDLQIKEEKINYLKSSKQLF